MALMPARAHPCPRGLVPRSRHRRMPALAYAQAMRTLLREAVRARRRPGHARARCSFCGKPESRGRRLVAGPSARICGECVALCVRVLADRRS